METKKRTTIMVLAIAIVCSFATGQVNAKSKVNAQKAQEKRYRTPSENPANVYFGDPHLHTALSMDAGAWGNNLGLEPAYRFTRGAEVTSSSGIKAKLGRPLDFVVIADHSDGYGFFPRLLAEDPVIMAKPEGKRWFELSTKGGNEGREQPLTK